MQGMSLEAFNTLDRFYAGLIPEIELINGQGAGEKGGNFVWVCTYDGMPFYRKMTSAEVYVANLIRISKTN